MQRDACELMGCPGVFSQEEWLDVCNLLAQLEPKKTKRHSSKIPNAPQSLHTGRLGDGVVLGCWVFVHTTKGKATVRQQTKTKQKQLGDTITLAAPEMGFLYIRTHITHTQGTCQILPPFSISKRIRGHLRALSRLFTCLGIYF